MGVVKISPIQGLMLGISSVTVTGHLLYIPIITDHAGRDSWISLLLALIPAVLIGFVVGFLAQRFTGYTLIEYSELILGKWIGKFFVVMFLVYFFHEASLSIRGFGEFYTSAITPRTPIVVFLIAILLLASYTVKGGIEVLARTNQAFLVIMIPIGIVASILTHKDKDYRNFLPVLEDGLSPVLKGSLSIISVFSSIIVLSMVLASVSSTKSLKKHMMLTMLILVGMFIGPVTGVIAVFGEERATGLYFPTFQILRDIEIGALQRLDIIGVMLWSLGSFSKVSLFLYAIVVGIAQLFRIKDYTVLVGPVSALLAIVSIINSEDFIGIYLFQRDIYPYYGTLLGFVFPLILLIVSKVRNIRKSNEGT